MPGSDHRQLAVVRALALVRHLPANRCTSPVRLAGVNRSPNGRPFISGRDLIGAIPAGSQGNRFVPAQLELGPQSARARTGSRTGQRHRLPTNQQAGRSGMQMFGHEETR